MQNPGNDRAAFCVFMSSSPHFLEKCLMRRRKQNILLNLLLGTGAYLLYSKRHQLGDIGDLRDRARESYETASRRIGRASDALRGKDHAVVRTATASLMGVGVGVGAGAYLLYSMRHRLGDIEDLRDRARESYETASRRIGRASDALRGKDHAVVRTATASLMGVGVGVGAGAYLLYSMRHRLWDIQNLRDRARESYETASRRIGRASDALRGKDHAVVRTATASLMGVGVGVGAGAYLLYSMRHRLGDIEDLRDRARESYETASRRLGRASDALRGKDHAVVRTATASLMGVGVGVGAGAYLLYSMRHRLGDIEDLRDRARESYETASRR